MAVATLTLTACGGSDSASSDATTMASSMAAPMASSSMASSMAPMSPAMAARHGTFMGSNGKQVAGTVEIDGNQVVLKGFSSDEGPDLHIYLANGTDEAAVSAGKELAPVAWNQGMQTFTVDAMDARSYTDVVIHCDKAKAVFGAASLSS